MDDDLDEIRTRLRARFAPGWPPSLAVPDTWLPHLAELDRKISEVLPDYQLVQVKSKFGGLRYYLEIDPSPPCCRRWREANVYDEAQEEAWLARLDVHEATDEHRRVTQGWDRAREHAERLAREAEEASYRW